MFQPRTDSRWQRRSWGRFIWRVVPPVLAASFVLVYPIYHVLDAAITHGIHQDGNLLRVDMKAMSNFDLDQVSGVDADIPLPYRQLDGKRVELAGQMWVPGSAAGPLDKFDLCYSIANCCFNGPPRIQHFVKATVLQGAKVEYYPGVVNVIGTLHVGIEHGAQAIASVYRLDVEKVEP
ncbi:MAG TPA: hypothetical protein VL992_19610 [Tepidisphaeraceae bacterium]|nr:hypothetical protein [Tepidisphaeraceae bacterium]